MSYVIYALFQVPGVAETALRELSMADLPKDSYKVFVYKKGITQDVRASESDARTGLAIGVGVGALAGALFGWLLGGPLGLVGLPVGSAVLVGMLMGIVGGGLGGGLFGSGVLHRNLQRLVNEFRPGQTLVTAEMETSESRHVVDQIFKKHGAIEASRGRRRLSTRLPSSAEPGSAPKAATSSLEIWVNEGGAGNEEAGGGESRPETVSAVMSRPKASAAL